MLQCDRCCKMQADVGSVATKRVARRMQVADGLVM